MRLDFAFKGSVIATVDSDCVPQIGSTVTIRTESYKSGINGGSVISFSVGAESPLEYDYSKGGLAVTIIVESPHIHEDGPEPEG